MDEKMQEKLADANEPTKTAPKETRISRILKFTYGFISWYLAYTIFFTLTGLKFGIGKPRTFDEEEIFFLIIGSLFSGVAYLGFLVLLFAFRSSRFIGWGLLAAIGTNLVISLALGLIENAGCFVPFYLRFSALPEIFRLSF